jgi:hypothetical protein
MTHTPINTVTDPATSEQNEKCARMEECGRREREKSLTRPNERGKDAEVIPHHVPVMKRERRQPPLCEKSSKT